MFIQEHGLHITHGPDENCLERRRTNLYRPDTGAPGCHLGRKCEEFSLVSWTLGIHGLPDALRVRVCSVIYILQLEWQHTLDTNGICPPVAHQHHVKPSSHYPTSFVLLGWLCVNRINGLCFALKATWASELDSVKDGEFGSGQDKWFEAVLNFASRCIWVVSTHHILYESLLKKCGTVTVYYGADRYSFHRQVFGHSGFTWKD
jgi:hypothetical protein